MGKTIEDILQFWFGELNQDGMSSPACEKRWFTGGADFDREINQQFGALVDQAVQGNLDHWADADQGLIALVLLLDQFTRNIYRDTPQAFAGDPIALELSRQTVAAGRDVALPRIHRVFLYIPYEHSEDLGAQNEGVALFDRLLAEFADPRISSYRDYAVAHRNIIDRFGRFPHRNASLGRDSSAEELEHLKHHGGF